MTLTNKWPMTENGRTGLLLRRIGICSRCQGGGKVPPPLPVVVCVLEVPHLHLVPGEGTRVRHAEGKRDLRLSVFWFCRESIVGV